MVLAESSGGSAGGEYLQGVVAKTRATGLVNWPQLKKNDYELFGEFIEVYSFIDFNLRRLHGSAGSR